MLNRHRAFFVPTLGLARRPPTMVYCLTFCTAGNGL
jgi:hypothetical protein